MLLFGTCVDTNGLMEVNVGQCFGLNCLSYARERPSKLDVKVPQEKCWKDDIHSASTRTPKQLLLLLNKEVATECSVFNVLSVFVCF